MAKQTLEKLDPLTAKKVKTPGRHSDGGGLYLAIDAAGRRRWVFMYVRGGKRTELGLGGGRDLGLKDARREATRLRTVLRDGGDPRTARAAVGSTDEEPAVKAPPVITFKEAAEGYITANEAGWRNAKHRAQWRSTLQTYAYPQFGDERVSDVSTADVMAVLDPIWRVKPETASRLRGRIEAVIDNARARGWLTGENPARWRGHVANMLPKRSKVAKVKHHAALPWEKAPAFMVDLAGREAMAARALEFVILTAGRTGEIQGARWCEVDLTTNVWTVPGDRMKAGREHRVPLSPAAVAILNKVAALRPTTDINGEALIFPGARDSRPLSQMSMLMLLRRMDQSGITAHGFRSTFRDWCAEATEYPHEMAEIALAHTVSDKVEAAYRRGDMIEKRRQMMTAWAEYLGKT